MASNFCGKCGSPVSGDGTCPVCNPKPVSTPAPQNPQKAKKSKKPLIITLIAVGVALVLALGVFLLFHFGVFSSDEDKNEKEGTPDNYELVISSILGACPWTDRDDPVPGIDDVSPLICNYGDPEELFYALIDLDSNGEEELVISARNEEGIYTVLNIYTIFDDALRSLAFADENVALEISDTNSVLMFTVEGEDCIHYDELKLNSEGSSLETVVRVSYDAPRAEELGYIDDALDVSEDEEGECWFYTEDPADEDSYEHITEDEAKGFIVTYDRRAELDYTPIEDYSNEDDKGTDTENPQVDSNTTQKEPDETEAVVEEKPPYTVLHTTSFSDGNIEPVNEMVSGIHCPIGVCKLYTSEGVFLVDYEGNKVTGNLGVCEFGINYCDVCGAITDHVYAHIDPHTLEVSEVPGGHGGGFFEIYYVPEEQIFFNYSFQGCTFLDIEDLSDHFVAILAEKRPATEDEVLYSGLEYGLESLDKYGIIVNGVPATDFSHDMAIAYNDGICALSKDGKWGYFNEKGEQILDFEYEGSDGNTRTYAFDHWNNLHSVAYGSSFGLIPLCKDGMWGYCDRDGIMVTDFEFEEARPVWEGLAYVKQDGVWKVISFDEYGEGISIAEATKLLEEAYNQSGNYSADITLLPEAQWKPCYNAVRPTFRVVKYYGDGGVYELNVTVLANGIFIYDYLQ